MPRVNTASIAGQLHALGFTMAGAQQLITGQMLGDAKDRKHLALFLAGLFEAGAVQAIPQGGRPAMKTQSGIVIELQDDGEHPGSMGASQSMAKQGTVPATLRTPSGLVVSFDDDA